MEKLIYLSLMFSLLVACNIDCYYCDGGISIDIRNYSKHDYDGAVVYIGALRTNQFIKTDSLIIDEVIPSSESAPDIDYIGNPYTKLSYPTGPCEYPDCGWQPDMYKIRDISDVGTYLFRLADGREVFLGKFTFPNPTVSGVTESVRIYDDELLN